MSLEDIFWYNQIFATFYDNHLNKCISARINLHRERIKTATVSDRTTIYLFIYMYVRILLCLCAQKRCVYIKYWSLQKKTQSKRNDSIRWNRLKVIRRLIFIYRLTSCTTWFHPCDFQFRGNVGIKSSLFEISAYQVSLKSVH